MDSEKSKNTENGTDNNTSTENEINKNNTQEKKVDEENLDLDKKEEKKLTPEEELEEIKDKLARTFAEMENQRRRFEKEKEDAYEYGGYSFAKEALNLLDNLERSKAALEND